MKNNKSMVVILVLFVGVFISVGGLYLNKEDESKEEKEMSSTIVIKKENEPDQHAESQAEILKDEEKMKENEDQTIEQSTSSFRDIDEFMTNFLDRYFTTDHTKAAYQYEQVKDSLKGKALSDLQVVGDKGIGEESSMNEAEQTKIEYEVTVSSVENYIQEREQSNEYEVVSFLTLETKVGQVVSENNQLFKVIVTFDEEEKRWFVTELLGNTTVNSSIEESFFSSK